MFESIHAGQDDNFHGLSASMFESTHSGQDNNVYVPSVSMFPKIITGRKYFLDIQRLAK